MDIMELLKDIRDPKEAYREAMARDPMFWVKFLRRHNANTINGGEEYFCIDTKPIEVCRVARGKRCTMGRTEDFDLAPDFGYRASQGIYYLGYKLHTLCGLSGAIHSYDLSKTSVHDTNYLKRCEAGILQHQDLRRQGIYQRGHPT